METNNKNKFIVVSYALYDVTNGDNGEEMLIERTTDERPFIFISGIVSTAKSCHRMCCVTLLPPIY